MLTLATILLLGCISGVCPAQDPPVRHFQTGHLTEDVPSESAPDQQFALYLPPGFDPARPTPIIYLMDPRGRARVPAKVFKDAAARYGYILISSESTLSDGPVEPNLRALEAMWADTHAWFTIDPARVYIAGFSGTARTATLIAASRPGRFTGVIGSGAGFHPDVKPAAGLRLLYFGAVGDVDYNFHELETLEQALVSANLPHRIERFPGPHSWMPPDVAMRAVEWLELRAMQAGTRERDAALVDAWWAREGDAARACLDEGRALDAARQYAAMARDFAGLRDTAAVALAATHIAASPAARADLKRRQNVTRQAREWVTRGLQTIAHAFPAGETVPAVSLQDLARQLELERLKKAAAGAPREPRETALEAQRRLNQLEVQLGFYMPHYAIERADLSRAGYYLSLAMQVDDRSPVSWYLMAQRYGRLNDMDEALAALRRAVAVGFRDLTLVQADPSFRRLRGTPGYQALVDELTTAGDTLDKLTVDRPPFIFLR
jgi:predicted esterase